MKTISMRANSMIRETQASLESQMILRWEQWICERMKKMGVARLREIRFCRSLERILKAHLVCVQFLIAKLFMVCTLYAFLLK